MKARSRQREIKDVLSGKRIVLMVTGCIAAYKACTLVSMMRKAGAEVKVVMTENATEFVAPLTFETLSANRVIVDTFSRDFPWEVEHVSLAKWADLFLVAPATANVIGKVASGIADDMLTTTVMAARCTVALSPAMNTAMYNSDAVQANLAVLRQRGFVVIEPESGVLACGDEGKGRFPEPEDLFDRVVELVRPNRSLEGKTVIVTAGGTSEPIDPVRSITNRSSGKMGVAIATEAAERGARVVLIHGNITVPVPATVEAVKVGTTVELFEAVSSRFSECDALIMAAAPADYRVAEVRSQKIKDGDLTLSLVKNPDIAQAMGEIKGNKKLVVFAAETEDLVANARKKLIKKNADFVVANDVTEEGAGFNVDTNVVTIVDGTGEERLGKMPKREVAKAILDRLVK